MNKNEYPSQLQSKCGQTIIVDSQGSLGLLALGDIGLQLWRAKKKDEIQKGSTHSTQLKFDNGE